MKKFTTTNPNVAPFSKQGNILDEVKKYEMEMRQVKKPTLPNCITFDSIRPIGYVSKRNIVSYTPTGMKSTYKPGEYVKFIINGNEGFWDPYSCHLEIEVTLDESAQGYKGKGGLGQDGLIQLDGSAQSLISNMSVRSRGKELEDVGEYDTMCNIMYDLNMGVEARKSCSAQGVGYGKAGFTGHIRNTWRDQLPVPLMSMTQKEALLYSARRYYSQVSNDDRLDDIVWKHTDEDEKHMMDIKGRIQSNGMIHYHPMPTDQFSQALALAHTGDPDSESNYIPWIDNNQFKKEEVCRQEHMYMKTNYKFHHGMNSIVKKPSTVMNNIDYTEQAKHHPMSQRTDLDFSTSFCNTSFEPCLGNVNQWLMIDGRGKSQPRTSARFSVPLQSGILGCLMPAVSYKLLPMNGLKDLELTLQINPYAFFSSGYRSMRDCYSEDQYKQFQKEFDYPEWCWNPTPYKFETLKDGFKNNSFLDIYQNQISNQYLQYPRNKWKITKIELHVEIIDFGEVLQAEIDRQLLSPSGIVLHTSSMALGGNIPLKASPSGFYTIDQGFESLRSMFLAFIPRDYEKYNYCRKQFRLSHNLQSFQIRVGNELIPQHAVEGHAGNCVLDTSDLTRKRGNNSDFIYNLKKAVGKQNEISFEMFIDNANFCVNDRIYDPTAVGPYSFVKRIQPQVVTRPQVRIEKGHDHWDQTVQNKDSQQEPYGDSTEGVWDKYMNKLSKWAQDQGCNKLGYMGPEFVDTQKFPGIQFDGVGGTTTNNAFLIDVVGDQQMQFGVDEFRNWQQDKNGAECFDGYVWDNSFPMSFYQYLNWGIGLQFINQPNSYQALSTRLEGMVRMKENSQTQDLMLDEQGNVQVYFSPVFENILFTKKEPRSRQMMRWLDIYQRLKGIQQFFEWYQDLTVLDGVRFEDYLNYYATRIPPQPRTTHFIKDMDLDDDDFDDQGVGVPNDWWNVVESGKEFTTTPDLKGRGLSYMEPVIDIYGGLDYGGYNPFNGEIVDILMYFGGNQANGNDTGSGNNVLNYPIVNMHTSMGLPFFYENKCVGKAVFGLDLETLSESDNLITGINTVNRTPYQIMLNSHTHSSAIPNEPVQSIEFERPSNMKVFHYYDILITMSAMGIESLGKT